MDLTHFLDNLIQFLTEYKDMYLSADDLTTPPDSEEQVAQYMKQRTILQEKKKMLDSDYLLNECHIQKATSDIESSNSKL
jgi:hypothetical protein